MLQDITLWSQSSYSCKSKQYRNLYLHSQVLCYCRKFGFLTVNHKSTHRQDIGLLFLWEWSRMYLKKQKQQAVCQHVRRKLCSGISEYPAITEIWNFWISIKLMNWTSQLQKESIDFEVSYCFRKLNKFNSVGVPNPSGMLPKLYSSTGEGGESERTKLYVQKETGQWEFQGTAEEFSTLIFNTRDGQLDSLN